MLGSLSQMDDITLQEVEVEAANHLVERLMLFLEAKEVVERVLTTTQLHLQEQQ